MARAQAVPAGETATSLVLQAVSILKLGIVPHKSLTARKSNSELVCSISELLASSLSPEPAPESSAENGHELEKPNYAFESTSKALYIPDPASFDRSDYAPEDKAQLELTVKFWYLCSDKVNAAQASKSLSPACVEQALGILKQTTGLETVDTLILQLPKLHFDDAELADEEEEELVQNVKGLYTSIAQNTNIQTLGLSEFSLPRLKRLYKHRNELKKVPAVNQVNLRDCCSVNQDLVDFAKKEELELLTHSDCSNLLPESTFSSLIEGFRDSLPSELLSTLGTDKPLHAKWVMKYTVLLKERSLVADKGYIVFASA